MFLNLRRARAYALMVILVFGIVYGAGIARRTGMIDGFGHIIGVDLLEGRTGGLMVLDHRGADLYDVTIEADYQKTALGHPGSVPGMIPFIWPPFVAFFYVPFALVPHGLAFVLWSGFSLACLAAALLVMRYEAPLTGAHWKSIFLLGLSFYPTLEGLMAGNNSLITVAILALVYRALRSGKDMTAGLLLGLQFYRPQLALAPLIVLGAKRRWAALGGAAVMAAVWVVLTEVYIGRGVFLTWLALGPGLNRMIFEPGMPYALLSSVSALFLLPLGPQHLAFCLAAGAVVSAGLIALLLAFWRGPWNPQDDRFALRFAALIVIAPLVGQYLLLHDLDVLILTAVLVSEYWLANGARKGWGVVRLVFAAVWLACLIGPPIITRLAPLPLAPLSVLLLGWAVAYTYRKAASASKPAWTV
jgi:hypothetical protein